MWTLGLVINLDIRGFSGWAKKNESYAPILLTYFYNFINKICINVKEYAAPSNIHCCKRLGDGGLIISSIKAIDDKPLSSYSPAELLGSAEKEKIKKCLLDLVKNVQNDFATQVRKPLLEAGGRVDNLALGVGISFGMLKAIQLGENDYDFFGSAINLTSRLCNIARPQGVIVDFESMPFLIEDFISLGLRQDIVIPKDFPPMKAGLSSEVTRVPIEHPRRREDYQHKIEVHVAAITFKQENGQLYVLAGKRKQDRQIYPGFWEFGGGQVHLNESFENAVKRQMWEEFGVKVNVLEPLTFYTIPCENKSLIPGVRIICLCVDEGSLKEESLEHDIIRWLPVSDIFKLKFIPGLKEIAIKAKERLEVILAS